MAILGILMGPHAAGDDYARDIYPPERSISIVVAEDGFYPDRISVFTGEVVHFNVTAVTSMPSCLILEGHEVLLEARPRELRHQAMSFSEPGRYQYYCPGIQRRGVLTVLEHPVEHRARDRMRQLASEKKRPTVWMPREK